MCDYELVCVMCFCECTFITLAFVCENMYLCVCMCVCLRLFACICFIYMGMNVHVCDNEIVYARMCACVNVHFGDMRACVRMCINMCMCIFFCALNL